MLILEPVLETISFQRHPDLWVGRDAYRGLDDCYTIEHSPEGHAKTMELIGSVGLEVTQARDAGHFRISDRRARRGRSLRQSSLRGAVVPRFHHRWWRWLAISSAGGFVHDMAGSTSEGFCLLLHDHCRRRTSAVLCCGGPQHYHRPESRLQRPLLAIAGRFSWRVVIWPERWRSSRPSC